MSDYKISPKQTVKLADISTKAPMPKTERDAVEKQFKKLRKELIELQNTLYAEDKQSLLIVFQAMDAGGKDGTIRNVFKGVNPQGVQVASFKGPTKEELAHDFLWRIHQHTPMKGMMQVFNRSHYEDVLVVRVHDIVPESVWRPRYQHINNFENLLSDSGTRILKFYLHISKDEQKERFQDRLDVPEKNWKFDVGDLEKRTYWDSYMEAFEEMLYETSTERAPWFVIPADNKWYRNLAIMQVVVDTLKDMNPQYPESDDLSGIVIE